MEALIIRKAEQKDLEQLYTFEQGVISAEHPFDTTLKEDPIRYYDLEAMLTSSTVELAVAEINHRLIGSGYARIEESKAYLKHPRYAYLGFMYVVPEHRGKGINKKIMEHLIHWTREQDITELRLEVYLDNIAAIKAYEKLGFSKHMIEMRLGL